MSQYQNWELTPNKVIDGLLVTASGLTLTIGTGVARVDGVLKEQTTASNLTTEANTVKTVYINPAKDYDGNSLTMISFTKEPDHTKANINGSTGYRFSRSLPLAKITTTANFGTVTISGTWAAADTATATIDGTAVQVTAADGVVANIAALLRDAINANATLAPKVVATSSAGVVTVTAKTSGTASAYTFTATESTAGNGTAVASGSGNLAGAAVTVDNTVRENFAGFIGMRSEMGD